MTQKTDREKPKTDKVTKLGRHLKLWVVVDINLGCRVSIKHAISKEGTEIRRNRSFTLK